MSIKILLLVLSAVTIVSCNTAYKSGQTPDDVYYSPLRVVEEDSQKEDQKEDEQKDVANNENSAEEREIRMKIQDRRWRDINDGYDCNCSCDHTPYKYGYNNKYYYNPYYYPYPVYLPDTRSIIPKNTTARMSGLGGYNTVTTAPVVNPKTGKTEYVPAARTYNNNNQQTREVITPVNNNRTYSPSSNSSGTNNSGSGNSVPRPRRN